MKLISYLYHLVLLLPCAIASPASGAYARQDDSDSNGVRSDDATVLSTPINLVGSSEGNMASMNSQDSGNAISDLQALNAALHLSHLTSAFYTSTLALYSNDEFIAQGNEYWVRGRYNQIGGHNQAHKSWLTSAITAAGGTPVDACEYHFDFPQGQLTEFFKMSEAIEQIATSTLGGLLSFVDSKDYLTVLASMLGVESRHTSWIMSAIRKQEPWDTAFETPLSFSQAYHLLSYYITSCPSSNLPLLPSLRTYSPLDIPLNVTAGSPLKLGFDDSSITGDIFASFVFGTGSYVLPIRTVVSDGNPLNYQARPLTPGSGQQGSPDTSDSGYWVTIPKDLQGQGGVYFFLTTSHDGSEDGLVAGPGLLSFPYDAVTDEDNGGADDLDGFNMMAIS